MRQPITIKLSEKYNKVRARQYGLNNKDSLFNRLSHYRDEQMIRAALQRAGDPGLLLDLPCGTGRFWNLLTEKPNRVIIAADHSRDALKTAMAFQPAETARRVKTLHTSVFDIQLPNNAVDNIFCMRLIHHIEEAEHRLALLKEFNRVTRETVILSLWVDGNFKSWKHKRQERRRQATGQHAESQGQFVIPRSVVEAEFRLAGFEIETRLDFIPLYAMWRVYVLRKV